MQGVTVTLILRTEKPRPAGGVLLAQSHTPGLGGHGFAGCSPGGANPCSGRRALTGQTFAREGAWTRGSPAWKPHPARAACHAASVEPQELQGSKGLALSKAPVDPRRDACAQEAGGHPTRFPGGGRGVRGAGPHPPLCVCRGSPGTRGGHASRPTCPLGKPLTSPAAVEAMCSGRGETPAGEQGAPAAATPRCHPAFTALSTVRPRGRGGD